MPATTEATSTTLHIDRRWLKEHGACSDQVDLLTAEWPEGATVTRAVLIRAAELGADLDWFANKILPAPALAAYNAARATALADALNLD